MVPQAWRRFGVKDRGLAGLVRKPLCHPTSPSGVLVSIAISINPQTRQY